MKAALFLFSLVSLFYLARSACPSLPSTLPTSAQLANITELPSPFKFFDGTALNSTSDWDCKKGELATLTKFYEYGDYPPAPDTVKGTVSGSTLNIAIASGSNKATLTATLSLPSGSGPFPAFINAGGLPATFTSRGFALVTLTLPNIAADSNSKTGTFWSVYPKANTGVLLAWAWGYHRVIDVLLDGAVPQIDGKRVAVIGHSRYGKAALAAAAFDSRVTLGVPMSSGLSGVGPYRFFYEQNGDAEHLSNAYGYAPWWYTPNLAQFQNSVGHLPFDQHDVVALVAPRSILITEGLQDYWTNPEGTSVVFSASQIIFKWLGVESNIGINFRNGDHGPTSDDWNAILDFADWKLQGKTVTRNFTNAYFPAQTYAYSWGNPPK